jgi:hypothetical protein
MKLPKNEAFRILSVMLFIWPVMFQQKTVLEVSANPLNLMSLNPDV